jgi:hypothetical protein
VYLTEQALEKPRNSLADGADLDVALEIPLVNGGEVDGAWMHVLAFRLQAQGVAASERNWLQAETTVKMIMNCSILNCAACVYSQGTETAGLYELQNLCNAAQQCGVERCAGTLVNMRKPLYNLGNVPSCTPSVCSCRACGAPWLTT